MQTAQKSEQAHVTTGGGRNPASPGMSRNLKNSYEFRSSCSKAIGIHMVLKHHDE